MSRYFEHTKKSEAGDETHIIDFEKVSHITSTRDNAAGGKHRVMVRFVDGTDFSFSDATADQFLNQFRQRRTEITK